MRPKEIGFILDSFKERVVNVYLQDGADDWQKDEQYKIIYMKYLRQMLAEIRDTSTTQGIPQGRTSAVEPIESSIPRHMRKRRTLPDGIVV